VTEQRLNDLFTPDCDPYRAGAAALFDKAPEAISQDERDVVKRVFMRMAMRRAVNQVQALGHAAKLFHEIAGAIYAELRFAQGAAGKTLNAVIAEKLRGDLRSPDQLRAIAADGFELCVRELHALGAPDVTIHECGERDMEAHW
jgi:hypothetical protein